MAEYDQRHQTVTHQFNAETINFIQGAIQTQSRKRWRQLAQARYVTVNSTERAWIVFYQYICVAATEALKQRSFEQFTLLIFAEKIAREGQEFFEFSIYTPSISLGAGIDRKMAARRKTMEALIAAEASSDRSAVQRLRDEDAQTLTKFYEIWTRADFPTDLVGQPIQCIHVTVDRDSRTVGISEAPVVSGDPDDFPDHVTVTSEALAFAASYFRSLPFFVTSIDSALRNYPLLKLLMYVIDKRELAVTNFRVNADDEEEWDFEYPQFDSETLRDTTPK